MGLLQYSGGTCFSSRSKDRLSCLRRLVLSVDPSVQSPGEYFKLHTWRESTSDCTITRAIHQITHSTSNFTITGQCLKLHTVPHIAQLKGSTSNYTQYLKLYNYRAVSQITHSTSNCTITGQYIKLHTVPQIVQLPGHYIKLHAVPQTVQLLFARPHKPFTVKHSKTLCSTKIKLFETSSINYIYQKTA